MEDFPNRPYLRIVLKHNQLLISFSMAEKSIPDKNHSAVSYKLSFSLFLNGYLHLISDNQTSCFFSGFLLHQNLILSENYPLVPQCSFQAIGLPDQVQ